MGGRGLVWWVRVRVRDGGGGYTGQAIGVLLKRYVFSILVRRGQGIEGLMSRRGKRVGGRELSVWQTALVSFNGVLGARGG